MPTLTHYQTLKLAETNAVATISAKLDAPDLRMDDFALMVKAAELIEDVQDRMPASGEIGIACIDRRGIDGWERV